MAQHNSLHQKTLLTFWWCGIISTVTFFVAIGVLMRMIPPPDPLWSAETLTTWMSGHLFTYKIGIVVALFAGALLLPWTVMVSYQVWRMEEGRAPVLSISCLAGGATNAFFTMFPFILWAGASYRIGEGAVPSLVLMINDAMWLEFVILFAPFVVHLVCIGVAGLNSTAKTEVLPRWYCYYTLWVALSMMGGGVAVFFKDGPFAWNGVIGWWLVVVMFAIYFLASFFVFRRVIKQENSPGEFRLSTAS